MPSCEYCRGRSDALSDGSGGYYTTMAIAEREGWPCTKNTEEGARLRAGDFWDEARKCDTRNEAHHTPEDRG